MTDLEKIYNEGKGPQFEAVEQETVVKTIFNAEDEKMIAHLLKKCMGLADTDRMPDGMIETPHRVLKAWTEMFASGYMVNPDEYLKKTFDVDKGTPEENGAATNGIVYVSFDLVSQCEHHILPFFGKAHIFYIPDKKVVGLSKIPRMARAWGHRFQIQEQLTQQIAGSIERVIHPLGVMVILEDFMHTCVSFRGALEKNSRTTTSVVRGVFDTDSIARAEALALMKK